jgi:hypothetical protein
MGQTNVTKDYTSHPTTKSNSTSSSNKKLRCSDYKTKYSSETAESSTYHSLSAYVNNHYIYTNSFKHKDQ